MLHALFFGMLFAFGLVLPLGPQNIFVINQGAKNHKLHVIGTIVLTAALCDTALILIAVFGVGVIVLEIAWIKYVMLSAGILFLLYLGVMFWRSPPAVISETSVTISLKKMILMTMAVSLLNPAALIDAIITIGSASLVFSGELRIAFTLGCIATSWLWFTGLAMFGKQLQRVDSIRRNLNKISAVLMWLAASYLIYQLIGLI